VTQLLGRQRRAIPKHREQGKPPSPVRYGWIVASLRSSSEWKASYRCLPYTGRNSGAPIPPCVAKTSTPTTSHLQMASAARQDLQGHIESIMPMVEEGICGEERGTWLLEEEGASLLWLLLMLLRERCVPRSSSHLPSSIIMWREKCP